LEEVGFNEPGNGRLDDAYVELGSDVEKLADVGWKDEIDDVVELEGKKEEVMEVFMSICRAFV
jgi:hypothetical protein